MKDLFDYHEELPEEVLALLDKYSEMDMFFKQCINMLDEMRGLGYTFDYGLDASPHSLELYLGVWIFLPSVGTVYNKHSRLFHPVLSNDLIDLSTSFELEDCDDEWFEALSGEDVKKMILHYNEQINNNLK